MRGELDDEELQQIRSRATELLLKEDWNQYVNLYTHLISLCNSNLTSINGDPSKLHKTLVSALSNRAEAQSRLGHTAEALRDCDSALSMDPVHLKTLISQGKILLDLGQYTSALHCFQKAKSIANGNNTDMVRGLSDLCAKLEAISRTGALDFSDWVLNGYAGKLPELAEYLGPVEIKRSRYSGRGIFVTKNVEAGTVLMITKAVATGRGILPEESGERGQMVIWKDFVDKILNIVEKCERTHNLIYTLFNGEDESDLEIPDMSLFSKDQIFSMVKNEKRKEVDVGRVLKVLDVNCLTEDSISAKVLGKNLGYRGVGLWILPSFINHSCNPNTRRIHIGDWVVVHASRDIKAGEEITFAYINVLSPLKERREMVKKWGFECKCDRCRFETKFLASHRDIRELEESLVSNGGDLGGVVVRLEEGIIRRWALKEREKGYLRGSFWDAYSNIFGSERFMRKWDRKIPAMAAAESVFEAVGGDERVLKLVARRLRNGGNWAVVEMERIMRLARGTYGKVMKKQAFRTLLDS